jgi:capsular exopolysaccharide synthesis family protein
MESINIVTLKHPKSPITEAYRTLRTNIQFSSFDKKIKTIVITSTGPGEGKTTTSSNLAVAMAQGGHKTLILDCDLRKPRIHRVFNISNQIGLSNLLIGEKKFEEVVHKTEVYNLFVLTSGVKPPNPSELLASSKMQNLIEMLKESYDYVIIDTPPVIMVTDAQILSKYADGCLIVVSSGESDKIAAQRAKELLQKVDANILGVVLNKLDTSKKGHYEYYYQYYYGNDNKPLKWYERLGIKAFRRKQQKIDSKGL